MMSPLAYAIACRLDKIAPAADEAPAPGDYNDVRVAVCVIHPDGRPETWSATVDVTAGAPHDAAPTAGALTLAGVARMLDAIVHGAGAVAPHVRARAIAALVDDTAPADAGTVAEIEAVRAAARAALPRVTRLHHPPPGRRDVSGCAAPLLAAALVVATASHCAPGAHAMDPTIDTAPLTLAERLEDAGIVYVDTPDGYHINAGPEVTILIRPSPNDDGRTWVTVTRPDASERDTGGVSEDDYETATPEAAIRLVCSYIDCF